MARVLVVDDDSISCQLLGEVLQHDGLPVLWATDPFDALERVRRDPVDLAILDMRMPQMNGLELMRRLREQAPELPVIIMTAFGSIDTARRARRSPPAPASPKGWSAARRPWWRSTRPSRASRPASAPCSSSA